MSNPPCGLPPRCQERCRWRLDKGRGRRQAYYVQSLRHFASRRRCYAASARPNPEASTGGKMDRWSQNARASLSCAHTVVRHGEPITLEGAQRENSNNRQGTVDPSNTPGCAVVIEQLRNIQRVVCVSYTQTFSEGKYQTKTVEAKRPYEPHISPTYASSYTCAAVIISSSLSGRAKEPCHGGGNSASWHSCSEEPVLVLRRRLGFAAVASRSENRRPPALPVNDSVTCTADWIYATSALVWSRGLCLRRGLHFLTEGYDLSGPESLVGVVQQSNDARGVRIVRTFFCAVPKTTRRATLGRHVLLFFGIPSHRAWTSEIVVPA